MAGTTGAAHGSRRSFSGAFRSTPPAPTFDERDRAALAFIEAASRCDHGTEALAESVFAGVRRFYSEGKIAELARCLTDHHFLDDAIP